QPAMSSFILREQNQARSSLVKTVDNSRPLLATNTFDIGVISEHRVDQSPTVMTRRGMHHHTSRFIDNQQVIILKEEIEGNFFSDQICRCRWRNPNCHIGSSFK